jgi:hypothetical protein
MRSTQVLLMSGVLSLAATLKARFGVVMVHRNACGLANKLLDTLRQAMRKARG